MASVAEFDPFAFEAVGGQDGGRGAVAAALVFAEPMATIETDGES